MLRVNTEKFQILNYHSSPGLRKLKVVRIFPLAVGMALHFQLQRGILDQQRHDMLQLFVGYLLEVGFVRIKQNPVEQHPAILVQCGLERRRTEGQRLFKTGLVHTKTPPRT